jgi:anti-anti-sigma factor
MSTVVKIESELDAGGIAASVAFFERLAQDDSDIVLDLRSVAVLDGSGLGALMHVFKRKRALGARLAVANVSGQPRQLMLELKVLSLLELVEQPAAFDVASRPALAQDNLSNPAVNAR